MRHLLFMLIICSTLVACSEGRISDRSSIPDPSNLERSQQSSARELIDDSEAIAPDSTSAVTTSNRLEKPKNASEWLERFHEKFASTPGTWGIWDDTEPHVLYIAPVVKNGAFEEDPAVYYGVNTKTGIVFDPYGYPIRSLLFEHSSVILPHEEAYGERIGQILNQNGYQWVVGIEMEPTNDEFIRITVTKSIQDQVKWFELEIDPIREIIRNERAISAIAHIPTRLETLPEREATIISASKDAKSTAQTNQKPSERSTRR